MKTKSNVEFHPTLVIGLGGTGHGVLLELKKRLIEQFGRVPPIIQFLSFDTAEPIKRSEKTSDGKDVELEVNKERFILRVEDPTSILGSHNPHIEKWWPHGTLVSEIISGATQIRARGRLALFANYVEIKSLIKKRLTEVRRVNNINLMRSNSLSVSQRRNVEVFIVSSLAGGTGSGMFMDIAFITRSILSTSNVVGVFVMPQVFDQLPGTPFIKLNSYAALKEIEYLSKLKDTDRVFIDYGSNKVRVRRPPFDLVYLLDSINEQERVITDPEVLFSRIAHGIYVQIGSEMGVSNRNVMDNIIGTLDSAGIVENRSVRYCSFGVSSCTWPYKTFNRKLEAHKVMTAHHLISKLLEVTPDAPSYKADARRFAQSLNLTPEGRDALFRSLAQQGKGRPLRFDVPLPATINRDAGNVLRNSTAKFIDEAQARIGSAVEANFISIRDELGQSLRTWQAEASSRQDLLHYISHFMKHLEDEVGQLEREVEKEKEKCQEKLQGINYINAGAALNKAAKSIWRADRKMREACINYAGLIEYQCTLLLKDEQCQKATQLINAFLADIKRLLLWCGSFQSTLNQVSDNLNKNLSSQDEEPDEVREGNPFEHVLNVLPEISNHPIDSSQFIRWCIEKDGSLDKLIGQTASEIQSRLMDFIGESWGVSSNVSITDILELEARDSLPLDLSYLSHLAAPLWRYNGNKIPLNRRTINRLAYCSVKDGDSQHLENSKGGWFAEPEFITAVDEHEITFFNVTEGVPLFALQGIREMEGEYYALGNGACHLHRDWKNLPDLIPKHLTSDLCCFAVAQASCFNIINKNGQGLYTITLTQDGLPPREIPLTAEITTAYESFTSRPDLSQKIKTAIEKKIDEQGWFLIKEGLESHVDGLSNHMSTNGIVPADREFIETEIEAIREYLTDVGS
jgi:hypothetical protein